MSDISTLRDPNAADDAQKIIRPGVAPLKYYTLKESLSESYTGNTARVKATYVCHWTRRWEFCFVMLGYSEILTHSSGRKYVSRKLPHGYQGTYKSNFSDVSNQKDYGLPWLWATSIENIEGVRHTGTTSRGAPQNELAKVTLNYEALPYRLVSDTDMMTLNEWLSGFSGVPDESKSLARYVSKFVQPSAEYFALPFGKFYWVLDDDSVPPVTGSQLGYIVPSMEIAYTWHQVPKLQTVAAAPPSYAVPDAIRKTLGSVNNDTFDGYEKGTLLLTSVEVKPYRWIGGAHYSDITYKMKHLKQTKPFNKTTKVQGEEYSGEARGHNWFLYMPTAFNVRTFPPYEHHLITHNGNPRDHATDPGMPLYKEMDFKKLFQIDQ